LSALIASLPAVSVQAWVSLLLQGTQPTSKAGVIFAPAGVYLPLAACRAKLLCLIVVRSFFHRFSKSRLTHDSTATVRLMLDGNQIRFVLAAIYFRVSSAQFCVCHTHPERRTQKEATKTMDGCFANQTRNRTRPRLLTMQKTFYSPFVRCGDCTTDCAGCQGEK